MNAGARAADRPGAPDMLSASRHQRAIKAADAPRLDPRKRRRGVAPAQARTGSIEDRLDLTARGQTKRRQILDAAAGVLARRGYAGTQLSEIAEQAGTQPGSLYYHFQSREDLIEEVLQQGVTLSFARARAVVEALPARASAAERLEAALRAHLKFQLVESDYARGAVRSIGQYPQDMWSRINVKFRAYGKFFDGLIAAAMKTGQIDPGADRGALRMLILGAANWAPEWYRSGGSLSADQIADLLIRLIFRGVGKADPHGLAAAADRVRQPSNRGVRRRRPKRKQIASREARDGIE